MGQISLQIPQSGQLNSSEDPKISSDFTTLQTLVNGNIDATNVTAALAQSAAVNQAAQTVKAAVNISTTESRTNVAYGTLTTPDQVTGIVLPSNGLIAVWYQATWQESVVAAARAAIFIGANQLKVASDSGGNNCQTEAATLSAGGGVSAVNESLFTSSIGMLSIRNAGSYSGDVTTGQVVGGFPFVSTPNVEIGTNVQAMTFSVSVGGPCYIFAAAGTYTISVQFKASSGSVTASNRRLWVQAVSFA